MEEVWKDIPGLKYYQASSFGRIKSLFRPVYTSRKRLFVFHGTILKPRKDSYGYLVVNVSVNGFVKTKKVHRLVWEAFNGPIPDGMVINHKDEVKDNNNLENLCLMTKAENNAWGTRGERAGKAYSEAMKGRHFYEDNPNAKPIVQYTMDNVFVKEWSCIKTAAEYYGVSYASIWSNLNNKTKLCKGYIWKYKKEAV